MPEDKLDSSPRVLRSLVLGIALLCSASVHSQPVASNTVAASQYEVLPAEVGPIQKMWAEQRNKENQERTRLRIAIPHPGQNHAVSESVSPFTRIAQADSQTQSTLLPGNNYQPLVLCLALVLTGILAVRKFGSGFADLLNRSFNPWDQALALPIDDKAFSEFAASFRLGKSDAQPLPQKGPDSAAMAEFFERAPRLIQNLRAVVQQAARASSQSVLHGALADLLAQVHSLKGMSGLPALLPVWQMAAALEGLLKQLTHKPSNVTPSTMRSVSGGVDLIGTLCAPGLKSNLATHPPIRLLAVDDDRISRNVISLALKKSLHQPDLAENGPAALALAEKTHYDVVFLDVQMPAMDGFEVCTKIHATTLNRETPVVFVTCHSDFEARAKAALVGGVDLIGKPYLPFEIALKALTMILRRRLGLVQSNSPSPGETVHRPVADTRPAQKKSDSPEAFPARSDKVIERPAQSQQSEPALAQLNPRARPGRGPQTRRARRRRSEIQRRLARTSVS